MKLAIVDRDGTLNPIPEGRFVLQPDDWQAVPGAASALARLTQAGWTLVVLTLRPGLGRGLLDAVTLNAIHARMLRTLSAAGARSDAVFYCPHDLHPEGAGAPVVGPLLQQIGLRYGVSPKEIAVVGSDLALLEAAVQWGAQVHGVPVVSLAEGPQACRAEDAAPRHGIRWHGDLGSCVLQLLRNPPPVLSVAG